MYTDNEKCVTHNSDRAGNETECESQTRDSSFAVEMIARNVGDGPERIEYIPRPEPVETPVEIESLGSDEKAKKSDDLVKSLLALAHDENLNLCQQLELLVQFDELKGWYEFGAKSCAAWMCIHMRIDIRTAWERLRVGKCLTELPILKEYFKDGQLSWSKVRLLTRIATAENENLLALASLDATVSDVQRVCEEYRWPELQKETDDTAVANKQWERRRLNWRQLPDGSTQIRIVLPPEQAQNFLHGIEQCEEILYEEYESVGLNIDENANQLKSDFDNQIREDSSAVDLTPAQRRADAAVLLAERSISFAGEHLSPADRFQVVVNIDNDSLSETFSETSEDPDEGIEKLVRNPVIEGIGSIPVATARQLACDCSVVKLLSEQGEPLSMGRKQRVWPATMRRAILTRDRHCQFPGCTSHRYLHIHHIQHWVDGGETSVENGVCLCQYHHRLIHSGKYTIARVDSSLSSLNDSDPKDVARRKLLPTRSRFVVERLDTSGAHSTESKASCSHRVDASIENTQATDLDGADKSLDMVEEKSPRGHYFVGVRSNKKHNGKMRNRKKQCKSQSVKHQILEQCGEYNYSRNLKFESELI